MRASLRVVHIMWKRQIVRYLRAPPRIIGALAQPLLFLLAFGFGFGGVFSMAGQGDYITFLTPGIVAMSIMFTAVFSGVDLIWERQLGFLKETMVAPASRLAVITGRTLGGATLAAAQGVIVIFIASFVGFRPQELLLLPAALGAMLLIALLFTALGTLIATMLKDMQAFQLIMNFLVMPMFFLSGALFPLQHTQSAMGVIAAVNPLSYGVDALRGLLSAQSHYGIALDFTLLGLIAAALVAAASWTYSRIEV